jgi:hypothetical protein
MVCGGFGCGLPQFDDVGFAEMLPKVVRRNPVHPENPDNPVFRQLITLPDGLGGRLRGRGKGRNTGNRCDFFPTNGL